MKILMLLLLFVFAPAVLAADPDILLDASYTVPMPESHKDVSSFAVPAYRISTNQAGRRTMNFELPTDLAAGRSIPVTLELIASQGTHKSFAGPLGSAECEGKWVALSCSFKFRDLQIKAEDARAFIARKYGTGDRASRLGDVVAVFSTDPIGTASTRPLDTGCPGCSRVAGRWVLSLVLADGTSHWAELELLGGRGVFYSEQLRGTFTGLSLTGAELVGQLEFTTLLSFA